jgi:hypothetical protein
MYILLAAFAFYIFDAGHVYTTFLRMKAETQNDLLKLYGPLFIFLLLFYTSIYMNFSYVWGIVIYATFVHNVKQNYGIAIWKSRVSKLVTIWQFKFMFYFINTLCFVAFHVRTDLEVKNSYPYSSLLLYPNATVFRLLLVLYIILFTLFLYLCFKNNLKKWKSVIVPVIMTLTYAYSFLIARTFEQAMIPLVLSHGISYVALIDYSLKKILNKRSILLLALLLIVGASYEYFVTDILFILNLHPMFTSFFQAIALSFLFSHYYYDSYLWKRSNKDMSMILS